MSAIINRNEAIEFLSKYIPNAEKRFDNFFAKSEKDSNGNVITYVKMGETFETLLSKIVFFKKETSEILASEALTELYKKVNPDFNGYTEEKFVEKYESMIENGSEVFHNILKNRGMTHEKVFKKIDINNIMFSDREKLLNFLKNNGAKFTQKVLTHFPQFA